MAFTAAPGHGRHALARVPTSMTPLTSGRSALAQAWHTVPSQTREAGRNEECQTPPSNQS
jgi:hypothetical protein